MGFIDRLQHGWNAFLNRDPTSAYDSGYTFTYRPDRIRLTRGNDRTIITSVYNRIALDVAAIDIRHCRLDDQDRYISDVDSGLNYCLTDEANIDQTGRAFIQDVVMSMLDEGCVAIVPVETTFDPLRTGSYEIDTLRTGKILQWKPNAVQVHLYNDRTGQREDIWLPKKMVAIVENPLYAVMNEPNSILQRLLHKLLLLDTVDEETSSGKLDLIIQLPYIIKTEARKQQAEQRRKDIEEQLSGSKYGVAYTDGTEKITQLNRSLENNLMAQIEYLTTMLYGQLGITKEVMEGSADEKIMMNYYNRTIEPIIAAITLEMKRKFLTKTARTQGQSIMFFNDPFRLILMNDLINGADVLSRNEIMSSNEIRQKIGLKPSSDPKADQLVNSNINPTGAEPAPIDETGEESDGEEQPMTEDEYNQQMAELDSVDADLDDLEDEINHFDEDGDFFLDESDGLWHYASPYYDPVKAHEYYMENRELKSRTSLSGLNDAGKEAAKYVHKQINNERDAKKDALKEQKNNTVKQHSEALKAKISGLREQLKNMSTSEREANKDKINAQIKEMRADNKAEREKLTAEYKATRQSITDDAQNNYISELDKIKATAAFQKAKKKSSGSRKKSSSSKKVSSTAKTSTSTASTKSTLSARQQEKNNGGRIR